MKLEIESETTHVEIGSSRLPGILTIPKESKGVVVFAHGSGSSRLSPRNQHVAQVLQEAGLATLLFDLLDEVEAEDRRNVFEISFLTGRSGPVGFRRQRYSGYAHRFFWSQHGRCSRVGGRDKDQGQSRSDCLPGR